MHATMTSNEFIRYAQRMGVPVMSMEGDTVTLDLAKILDLECLYRVEVLGGAYDGIKIPVIKAIREVTGWQLVETKQVVDFLSNSDKTCMIVDHVSLERAREVKDILTRSGAKVALVPT